MSEVSTRRSTGPGPVRHLVRRGEGPTVVMVHGLGSRAEVFDPIAALLAPTYDVVAVDLPGFGRSEADPAYVPGPGGYADWLVDVLDELGVERPHLVGSSMGGGVALELGRRGRAASVTAFAPVGFWGRPGQLWAMGLLTGLRGAARAARPAVPQLARSTPGRAVLVGAAIGRPSRIGADAVVTQIDGLVTSPSFPAARRGLSGYDLVSDPVDQGALASIPVTIAWGTRDVVLVHRTQSRRARAALPAARHVDLAGCGHLPFTDDPERCARLVRETAG